MKYGKPDIALIDSAVFAIQGAPKAGYVPDSQTGSDPTKHQTSAAYEADE